MSEVTDKLVRKPISLGRIQFGNLGEVETQIAESALQTFARVYGLGIHQKTIPALVAYFREIAAGLTQPANRVKRGGGKIGYEFELAQVQDSGDYLLSAELNSRAGTAVVTHFNRIPNFD